MVVVVLDGNERSTLAVTRSLGRKGINVIVGSETSSSLSSSSKYCKGSFSYPSPNINRDNFLRAVKEFVAQKSEVILMPMTDATLSEILEKKHEFERHIKIPFCDYGKYINASDKVNLLLLARDLNVPIPKTLFSVDFMDHSNLIEKAKKMSFPLVVKPCRSRLRIGDKWATTRVQYAKDILDLKAILNREPFKSFQYVIQERINGPGIGIFLLIKDGNIIAKFAHKRLREKPPSGGVSVLCESIEAPPIAMDSAIKLLKHLDWFGVAMVEFKLDTRDHLPKLMEINARFWGSLELAITAGVDFPYLLYCLVNGEKIRSFNRYKVGIKLRWELGDLDHLFMRILKKGSELSLPPNAQTRIGVLKEFIADLFRASVKNEILRYDDPLPFLFEFRKYIKSIFS